MQSAGVDAEENMYTKGEKKKSRVLSSTLSEGRRRNLVPERLREGLPGSHG